VKRATALHHLRTLYQRLDSVDLETFPVIPIRMYVFGSVLSDKPAPENIDLLFEYENRPDVDPMEMLHAMMYGRPLPPERAVIELRRGMKKVDISFLSGTVSAWLENHFFPPDTAIRLFWEKGRDWTAVIDEIEHCPLPWDQEKENLYHFQQDELQRIINEQGKEAGIKWIKEVSGYNLRKGLPQEP